MRKQKIFFAATLILFCVATTFTIHAQISDSLPDLTVKDIRLENDIIFIKLANVGGKLPEYYSSCVKISKIVNGQAAEISQSSFSVGYHDYFIYGEEMEIPVTNKSLVYGDNTTNPTLKAEVDACKTISESDENNNTLVKTVTPIFPVSGDKADFVVDDIVIDNFINATTKEKGDPYAKVIVKNIGKGVSGISPLKVELKDASGQALRILPLSKTYFSGGYVGVSTAMPLYNIGQELKLEAYVDKDNAYSESNENNNSLAKTFAAENILTAAKPDLIVSDLRVANGELIADVKNIGGYFETKLPLAVKAVDANGGVFTNFFSDFIGTTNAIKNISLGKTTNTGALTFTVSVDSNQVIYEINESNNSLQKTINNTNQSSATTLAPASTVCVISPEGGNFFSSTPVKIACGSDTYSQTFQWGKSTAQAFSGATDTTFTAQAKANLVVRYKYHILYKGNQIEKAGAITKIFDANQAFCNVSPNAGKFSGNTNITVECGNKVKNPKWQWDSGALNSFNSRTNINFISDKQKKLNLSFTYDYQVGATVKEKSVKFNKYFQVERCVDSDEGQVFGQEGNVVLTANSSYRVYTDSCNKNTLTEYYCENNKIKSTKQVCSYGCQNNTCVDAPASVSVQTFESEETCAQSCSGTSCTLQSRYFKNDLDANKIASGLSTIKMPASNIFKERDLRWRISNALRMIGYEPYGIFWGKTVDQALIREIDCRLAKSEEKIYAQATKMPFFSNISGGSFKDNMPQEFAAYIYATIFDKLNAGSTALMPYTQNCLLASLCSNMVEPIVGGKKQCLLNTTNAAAPIIQSPGLFGFYSSGGWQFDKYQGFVSRNSYASMSSPLIFQYYIDLVHEFAHNLDSKYLDVHPAIYRYNRKNDCGAKSVNFRMADSPFTDDGIRGNQVAKNYVSAYAAGMTNMPGLKYAIGEYQPQEDFAESLAAYVILPEYFRSRMTNSIVLKAKYDFIRNEVFAGKEFTNENLKEISSFVYPDHLLNFDRYNKIKKFFLLNIN